jgi:DNA segregation ATPase FtsK/SpoIIIE, S-DNA-T family
VLFARFPDEHARSVVEAFERLVRDAGRRGIRVFATASRLTGGVGRVADLFPRRLILATAGRAEHVAAGGDARDHLPDAPVGRGIVDRHVVQLARTDAAAEHPTVAAPVWEAPVGVTGYVTRRPPDAAIERWQRGGVRLRAVDEHADPVAVEPDGRVVVVGSPEQWLARPRLVERLRSQHGLLVDAACEREARHLLAGSPPPPYAEPGRGRGWEYRGGSAPARVTIDPLAGT